MVNWYAVGLAAALIYILPKRLIARKIINYYKYRSLNAPPNTVIVILDNIGLNYEKARIYAKNGARVIIGGKSQNKIDTAKKEIIRWTKNKDVIAIQVNRHDKQSLRVFAQTIMDTEITVGAIINNMGNELSDLDIFFKTQELAKERFENHCLNFLYTASPDCDL